ncbi:MerR family transcriptional regulator [Oceanotoga sp. DSM 15011]|uniref:MerR family transcriptional regulator n=1 Tax=Oceanotoga sp. DSM 15011 TaxID=2984951 RepID=UPI0021F41C30|nr:MerR family transcriptional regulator [Oceanotoga sp. DSM 15011]UYP00347.1 MerR family transcriptional regulator [Oceanotoga sp. DSM 15011]
MEKHRIIPKEYMTVSEIAKKMRVTVRTLQYYDKEGFFSPSAKSDGGRRLYTDKDLVRLHQILSLKHLGFSLKNIKNKIMSLDTPDNVAIILTEQAADIKRKIQDLSKAYEEIKLLKAEVLQIQSVDFKKYASIIVNLQMGNKFYGLIKHFDEETLNHLYKKFDMESGTAFMNQFIDLNNKTQELQKNNVSPDSKEGQLLAKDFWKMIMDFTDGDMSIFSKLMEIGNINKNAIESGEKQMIDMTYIEKALDVYLTKLGINPFMEKTK